MDLLLNRINYDDELAVFNFTKLIVDSGAIEETSFAERVINTKDLLIELSIDGFNRYILNPVWNKAYSRSCFDLNNVRFDERYYYGEDLIFNLSVLESVSRVRFFIINCYNYIIDINTSISTSYCEDISVNTKATLDAISNLYRKYGIYKECYSELIEYYNNAINKVFAHREKYIAEKDLLRKKLENDAMILQRYIDYVK